MSLRTCAVLLGVAVVVGLVVPGWPSVILAGVVLCVVAIGRAYRVAHEPDANR